jgi:hypothetical protein
MKSGEIRWLKPLPDFKAIAAEIQTQWLRNPGMAGEPDLQTRIAQGLEDMYCQGHGDAWDACEEAHKT